MAGRYHVVFDVDNLLADVWMKKSRTRFSMARIALRYNLGRGTLNSLFNKQGPLKNADRKVKVPDIRTFAALAHYVGAGVSDYIKIEEGQIGNK